MAWGDLPDLPGLEDEYGSSPVPVKGSKRKFRPEIERLRPEAESRFPDPDELESWLEEQDRQLTEKERKKTSLLGTGPEAEQYLRGGRPGEGGQQSKLGLLRQSRAEEGRTAATTEEYAKLAAAAVAIPTIGGLAEAALPATSQALTLGPRANLAARIATGAVRAAPRFAAESTALSGATRLLEENLPGYENYPRPVKTAVRNVPALALPGSRLANLLGVAGSVAGSEAAISAAPKLGVSPGTAGFAGEILGGVGGAGYTGLVRSIPAGRPALSGSRVPGVRAVSEAEVAGVAPERLRWHATAKVNEGNIRRTGFKPSPSHRQALPGVYVSKSLPDAEYLAQAKPGLKVLPVEVPEGPVASARFIDGVRERLGLKLDDAGNKQLVQELQDLGFVGAEWRPGTEVYFGAKQAEVPRGRRGLASERGAIQPGGPDDLNELEQLLQRSIEFAKVDPELAKAVFSANARLEAAKAAEQAAENVRPFRETGRLRKRARQLVERLQELADESGRLIPEGRTPEETIGLRAAELNLLRQVTEAYEAGQGPEAIAPMLRELRDTQMQLRGETRVPRQEIPPQEPALTGEVQATLRPGEQPPAGAIAGPGNLPPNALRRQQLERALSESAGAEGIRGTAPPGAEVAGTGLLPGPLLEAGTPVGSIPSAPVGPEEALRLAAERQGAPLGPPGGPGGPPAPPPRGGGPEQPGLPGVPQPRKAGSVAASILRNMFAVPGVAIEQVTAYSPPLLRQGKVRFVKNPVNAVKEFGSSIRNAFSAERAEAMQAGLVSAPWVRKTEGGAFNSGYTWEDLGGHILQLGDTIEEREIVGDVWLARKLRGFGPRRISDRQAVLEMNAHRVNWFSEVAQDMWENGIDDIDEYRKLVKFIEHGTQRGSLGQPGNLPLFFSARAQSGRFQFLWDLATQVPAGVVTGKVLRPGVQQQAMKSLVAMTTANMAMMGTAAALGLGTLELSKDKLPILRRGKFHWDPWSGWNGPAKLILGIGKDTANELGEGDWDSAPEDLADRIVNRAERYVGTQLSPAFSAAVAARTGEDFAGREYNLGDAIKSGRLPADMLLPLNLKDIVEAYKESGVIGAAAVAAPSTLSEAVSVYQNLGELRDDAARQGVEVTDAEGNTRVVRAESYEQAGPLAQAAIDKLPQVAKYREENPSGYRRAQVAAETQNDYIQAARTAEENYANNQPITKPLREFWADETVARRTISQTLENQFAREFARFDKDKFEKAVEGYYAVEEKDPNGFYDPEATEVARKEYVAGLPADQQQWITEALQASEEKRSPLRQEYDRYLDEKESTGYFRKGITAQERQDLDFENPELDMRQWKFGSGVLDKDTGQIKAGPALQSQDGVALALSENPNLPVKFAHAKRPVNESRGSLQAWSDYAGLLEFYSRAGTPQVKDRVAQQLAGVTYDKLSASGKEKINRKIRDSIADDPVAEAALIWWGMREVPSSNTSKARLAELVGKYGPLLEKK